MHGVSLLDPLQQVITSVGILDAGDGRAPLEFPLEGGCWYQLFEGFLQLFGHLMWEFQMVGALSSHCAPKILAAHDWSLSHMTICFFELSLTAKGQEIHRLHSLRAHMKLCLFHRPPESWCRATESILVQNCFACLWCWLTKHVSSSLGIHLYTSLDHHPGQINRRNWLFDINYS